MATRVIPVVTLPNTLRGILDYLVARTADTIGEQVERADAIVVGEVRTSEARSVPVAPDHEAALQPWLSEETGLGPHLFVHLTTVHVERWLLGPEDADSLQIAYVYPAVTIYEGTDSPPLFDASDRGLLFLQAVSPNVPYMPYIPHPAYQLAPGEKWVRNFLVTDYDEQGEPFTRDETAEVEETVAAVQWYAGLPRGQPEALRRALLRGLDEHNTRIVRHAVRALAHRGDAATASAFKGKLSHAEEALRMRLMLGLWIAGERKAAQDILAGFFQRYGKREWLARWDIEPTLVEEGQPVDTLYGPDPVETKGD